MNFYERRVALLKKRVDTISKNPAPGKLKSNLMMYEQELERWTDLAEGWARKEPFVYACGQLNPLLHAMGFWYIESPANMADRAGAEAADRCLDLIRREGYPELACDRIVMPVVMPRLGDVPVPALVVALNRPCDLASSLNKAIALEYNVPIVPLSVSFDSDDETALKMLADDLGNMTEFVAKKFPNKKYDEAKLVEELAFNEELRQYSIKTYELLKRKPCIVDPREAFAGGGGGNPRNPAGRKAYAKARYEELAERAAKGTAALPNEKLRTIWTVTGYNNDRSVLDYLQERGVALLMRPDDGTIKGCGFTPGYGDLTQFGRKLTPLEEQAREIMNGFWLALQGKWVAAMMRLLKELQCDFLINFVPTGCMQTVGINQITEQTAMKELGMPTLHVEGRALFSEGFNKQEVLRQFADFIDSMLERKGLPRN